jgi:orotate phosphoribosyltransferase
VRPTGARAKERLGSPLFVAIMLPKDKDDLLALLAKHAYSFKPGGFVLVSGQVSDEYLECRMALSQPEALPVLGRVFLSQVDPRAVAVGGLTMGADPVAIATSAASAGLRPIRWFSVRKDAKAHGKKKLIEGDVTPGNGVVIVDDVVTTGGSTILAIQSCREYGLQIVQVIVLVDREQDGGLQKVKDVAGEDVQVTAIFTKREVRAAWQQRQQAL